MQTLPQLEPVPPLGGRQRLMQGEGKPWPQPPHSMRSAPPQGQGVVSWWREMPAARSCQKKTSSSVRWGSENRSRVRTAGTWLAPAPCPLIWARTSLATFPPTSEQSLWMVDNSPHYRKPHDVILKGRVAVIDLHSWPLFLCSGQCWKEATARAWMSPERRSAQSKTQKAKSQTALRR